ncbi:MAG: hypothetical protein WDW36_000575 [Sanguina aurantia]
MSDLLTSLQSDLNTAQGMLAQFLGNLLQVAGPVSISGEELMTPPPQHSGADAAANTALVQQNTQAYAEQLVGTFKNMARIIGELPQTQGSAEETDLRISRLQAQSAALHKEVQEQLSIAETKLCQVQDTYATVARAQLDNKLLLASGVEGV